MEDVWRFQQWLSPGELSARFGVRFESARVMLFQQDGTGRTAAVDPEPQLHPFLAPPVRVMWRVVHLDGPTRG